MGLIREKWRSFGLKPICLALGIARASYYRSHRARAPPEEQAVSSPGVVG